MPRYTIHHRIDTLLELWTPFKFHDFNFNAMWVDLINGRQNGWLAVKTMDAETAEEAFKQFSLEFYQIVDRVAFIGQCHTTADLEPFIILKNGSRRFFCRYAKKRGPVPLHFDDDELASLEALDQYNEKGDVFRYLREATNATSFYTMLVMLVSGLEAMAGNTDEKGRRDVDRGYIANNILKNEELCTQLFGYGTGIRNQILHGGFVDHGMHGQTNYNQIVYDLIVDYFNTSYRLKIDKGARGRPRTIVGSYEVWTGWCDWLKEDVEISLELLCEKFNAEDSAQYFLIVDRPDDF